MGATPRQRFEALARLPDEQIHLAEAALWIAAERYPGLEIADTLETLDALAGQAAPAVQAAASLADRAAALNRALFSDAGFAGNQDDYYDARNSFLNDVIERRLGIPITLSVVWIEVARRLGLDAAGVSFPGHFLTKLLGPPEADVIVDPFNACLLDDSGCRARLREVAGPQAALHPQMLRAATTREILARMLGNLKQVYVSTRAFHDALGCSERILLLFPDAPLELRDRGLLYQQLECFGAAASDLERFLTLAPSHPSAATVRRALEVVRGQAARVS